MVLAVGGSTGGVITTVLSAGWVVEPPSKFFLQLTKKKVVKTKLVSSVFVCMKDYQILR